MCTSSVKQEAGQFTGCQGVETVPDGLIPEGFQQIILREAAALQGCGDAVWRQVAQEIAAEAESVDAAGLEGKSGLDAAAGELPADAESRDGGVAVNPLPGAVFGRRIGLDLRDLRFAQADFPVIAREKGL